MTGRLSYDQGWRGGCLSADLITKFLTLRSMGCHARHDQIISITILSKLMIINFSQTCSLFVILFVISMCGRKVGTERD